MTQALCLTCGGIKFGALVPCTKCGSPPLGDERVDILFTDHNFGYSTLKELGRSSGKSRIWRAISIPVCGHF